MDYYSQDGQDKYLNEEVFNGKKNGVFVDVGAFDGVELSNTYFFEKNFGWSGICVEPIPSVFERLHENRSCTCVNACISDFNGEADFLHVDGIDVLSGLVDGYDSDHLERVNRETKFNSAIQKVIKVKCYDLNSLMHEQKINVIDYLSIDVEGKELDILKSVDWRTLKIKVVSVENNSGSYAINEFMFTKGYKFLRKLGADEIYARHDLKDRFRIFLAKVKSIKCIFD